MNDLTLPTNITGTNLALPSGGRSKNIAVIQAPLRPHAQIFSTANVCEIIAKGSFVKLDARSEPEYLPHLEFGSSMMENMGPESIVEFTNKAKTIRRLLYPIVVRMEAAKEQFAEFLDPAPEDYIDPAQAAVMAHGLVDAIAGKKRSEEDQAKLDGMLLMFDPTINAIGSATKLWGEIPQHPVVISLGILSMMFKTQKFCPAPQELAEACRTARGRLNHQHYHMEKLMQRLSYAEEIVFDFDRDEWQRTARENYEAAQIVVCNFNSFDHKKKAEMRKALIEIEDQIIEASIREVIGSNGKADVVKADVRLGEPIPRGVTPQPIPDELFAKLSKLPDGGECAWGLKQCQYFLTRQHIVIIDDNKVDEIIER